MPVGKDGTRSNRRPPARTPEQRNNDLVALSYDAAEEQIRSGKATSQLLTHFLKMGAAEYELQKQKLIHENELLRARTESIANGADSKELFQQAIDAMRDYKGETDDEYSE